MKKILSCIVLVLITATLSARQLHLVILGDDTDENVGLGVKKNIFNVEQSFTAISNTLKTKLKLIKLITSQATLTRNHIMEAIGRLSCKEEDILVFYYAGHGLRKRTNISSLPAGMVENERTGCDFVDFGNVVKRLIQKKAGFSLVALDCCNTTPIYSKELASETYTPQFGFDVGRIQLEGSEEALKNLFKLKGCVIASSCSPEEVSWYRFAQESFSNSFHDPLCGGVFTKCFLQNIFASMQAKNSKWRTILQNTKENCLQETQGELFKTVGKRLCPELEHHYQVPQFKIHLSKAKESSDFYKTFLFKKNPLSIVEPSHPRGDGVFMCPGFDLESIYLCIQQH